MERSQIEALVEAITERRKIPSGILLEVESMVATGQAGLEIAKDGIDSAELGHLFGFAASRHDARAMAASCFGDGAKASKTIGEHCAARRQMIPCPNRDGLQSESGYWR